MFLWSRYLHYCHLILPYIKTDKQQENTQLTLGMLLVTAGETTDTLFAFLLESTRLTQSVRASVWGYAFVRACECACV